MLEKREPTPDSVIQSGTHRTRNRKSGKPKKLNSVAAISAALLGFGAYQVHTKTALMPYATAPACDKSNVRANLKRMYLNALRKRNVWSVQRQDIAVRHVRDLAWKGEGRRCQAQLVIRNRVKLRTIYGVKWSNRMARQYEMRVLSTKRWQTHEL